jgi:hypothetical protein
MVAINNLLSHLWVARVWQNLRAKRISIWQCYFNRLSWLALIPAVSVYIGFTQVGWVLGGSERNFLTPESGLMLGATLYIGIILGISCIGKGIHWMEKTYGSGSSYRTCVVLATYVATPVLLGSVVFVWPILWLVLTVLSLTAAISIYLMFIGVNVMMQVQENRGTLYSVSIMTIALCVFVGMIITEVVLFSTVLTLTIR